MSYFIPGQNTDAFGRLRTSNPGTIFDSKLLRDADTFQWDDAQVSGTATSTYNANQASVTLATANTTGVRVRQTKRRFSYQPGKSSYILITGILGAVVANSTKRVGLFDDKNGLFFMRNSTGLYIGERTYTSGSAVDTTVLQSSWNTDKLDGTGTSGLTLDTTKTNIFWIDFEWLGVGSVRYGVVINGNYICCHKTHHSNILTLVYMSTPNLPVRWEIRTTANATDQLTVICSTVMCEGGLQETGKMIAIDRGVTALTTGNNTNIYPLIAVNLASTSLDTIALLQGFSLAGGTTTTYKWQIILNPTVAGTALAFTAIAGSGLQADVGTTNATTLTAGTGVVLLSGYGAVGQDSGVISNVIMGQANRHT